MVENIKETIESLLKTEGCSSHNCYIKPKTIGTNGKCFCLEKYSFKERLQIIKFFKESWPK